VREREDKIEKRGKSGALSAKTQRYTRFNSVDSAAVFLEARAAAMAQEEVAATSKF
jgi:hypothetical protein